MLSKRSVVALITLAAIGLVGLGVAHAAAQLMAQPTAVAVVDLQAVFDGAKILEQFRADQIKWNDDFKAQREAKEKELQNMKFELDALDKNSAQFRAKAETLQFKAYEFKLWGDFQQAKVQHEQGLQLHKLYRDTRTVVAQIAKEQGYDLVLYNDNTNEIAWNQVNELQAQIQLRKVLFANDAINITDQVVQRLNTMHTAG